MKRYFVDRRQIERLARRREFAGFFAFCAMVAPPYRGRVFCTADGIGLQLRDPNGKFESAIALSQRADVSAEVRQVFRDVVQDCVRGMAGEDGLALYRQLGLRSVRFPLHRKRAACTRHAACICMTFGV